jgi:Zn-dependent peptidase ImmA (M78 family)
MVKFHPWRVVRELGVRVLWRADLPGRVLGLCDPSSMTIYLNRARLVTQVERRCTLTHELVHLREGHQGAQPSGVEARVRAETARLLIPDDALESALCWTTDLFELAETLWVTEQVVRDRLVTRFEGAS